MVRGPGALPPGPCSFRVLRSCILCGVHPDMLHTSLIEDLNRLACAEDQDRYRTDAPRARDALDRLRWIDTSQMERFRRDGWLGRDESDLIERFLTFAHDRLAVIPNDEDPVIWTRGDPGWQIVRERAIELLEGLDAKIDIGVPGWNSRR